MKQVFLKNRLLPLAAGLLCCNIALADTCADLRTIQTHSSSHFDGWKKDAVAGGYVATFQLDGANSCTVSGDSATYSCLWSYPSSAALAQAYARMVEQLKSCGPLGKQPAGIINDQPGERQQGQLRQKVEVTGFDFADAGVMLLVGQMRLTGGAAGQARNELKFSFVHTGEGAAVPVAPGGASGKAPAAGPAATPAK